MVFTHQSTKQVHNAIHVSLHMVQKALKLYLAQFDYSSACTLCQGDI